MHTHQVCQNPIRKRANGIENWLYEGRVILLDSGVQALGMGVPPGKPPLYPHGDRAASERNPPEVADRVKQEQAQLLVSSLKANSASN